jgi:hypothetical protein
MSNFEYVTVIVSVVLALGFSHLLGSIGSIIPNPGRVRGYWLHFVWVFLLLTLHFQFWLGLWGLRSRQEFPVPLIASFLAAASLIFVAARVLVPELHDGQHVDLREHFLRIRVPFFSILGFFWLFLIASRMAYIGGSLFEPPVAAWLAFILLCILGAVLKRDAWHALIALAWLGLAMGHLLFVARSVAA